MVNVFTLHVNEYDEAQKPKDLSNKVYDKNHKR